MTIPGKTWRRELYLKWLWLSHIYSFYWAHKPLCQRFRGDVVRIGSVFLCRSCIMLYAGLAISLSVCGFFHSVLSPLALLLFVTIGPATLVLSYPPWYRKWPRIMRDGLRLMTGTTLALWIYILLQGDLAAGSIAAIILYGVWKAYLVARGRQITSACAGCAEITRPGMCTGFVFQADRLRQYEQLSTDYLMARDSEPALISKLR